MHTAFDIKTGMFAVDVKGEPATREDVLAWGPLSRMGIVMDRPYGALGAGLLALLATTAFFDVPGKKRRQRPIYPEIHLFHVGGRWGNFIGFDFFPGHKEVFAPADPRDILPIINSRGITHLVVPDRAVAPVRHRFKEAEAALDRLERCYAYSPTGGTPTDADITIAATDNRVLDNYATVLSIDARLEDYSSRPDPIPLQLRSTSAEENGEIHAQQVARLAEELRPDAPETRAARQRLADAEAAGLLVEAYRRIAPENALQMLGAP